MNENKKQTELGQLINVELLGVITRIAELSIEKGLDEEQEERFIDSLKIIINNSIAFAWGIKKMLNELDKKTPQEVQDQGELAKKKREPIIIFDAVKEHVGRDFYSTEAMDVAYSILNIFHENRIMVCDATEILDFCKEALQFSTVNKFE